MTESTGSWRFPYATKDGWTTCVAPWGSTFRFRIVGLRAVLESLDPSSRERGQLHWLLSQALVDSYLYSDPPTPSDLGEAIRHGRLARQFTVDPSPEQSSDLANALDLLWTLQSNPWLLTQVIDLLEQAVNQWVAAGATRVSVALAAYTLGNAYRDAADPTDPTERRARTIKWLSLSLTLGSLDPEDTSIVRSSLIAELQSGQPTDTELELAVAHALDGSLSSRRPGKPRNDLSEEERLDQGRPHLELGGALEALYVRKRDLSLARQGVRALHTGLRRLGPDHPDYPGYAMTLVMLWFEMHRQTAKRTYLRRAERLVARVDTITQSSPSGDQPLIWHAGGRVLAELARVLNDRPGMEAALQRYYWLLEDSPIGTDGHATASTSLASELREFAAQFQAPELLPEAVRHAQTGFDYQPLKRPDRELSLAAATLGTCLRDSFKATGRIDELRAAVAPSTEAVKLTQAGNSELAARLTNLAIVLSDLYEIDGSRELLDRALALYRDALEFPHQVPAERQDRLNDLILGLLASYADTRQASDLEEALSLAESLVQSPRSPYWAGWANTCANVFSQKFERSGQIDDLSQAVSWYQQAVEAAKAQPLEAAGFRNNLALALAARGAHDHNPEDLRCAELLLQESIRTIQAGHTDLIWRWSNLADIRLVSSQLHLELGRPDEADRHAKRAVEAARTSRAATRAASALKDARALPCLANLARALEWFTTLRGSEDVFDELALAYYSAAHLEGLSPIQRFQQKSDWARFCAAQGEDEQARTTYLWLVNEAESVAAEDLPVRRRLAALSLISNICEQALEFFLGTGRYGEALFGSDQTRSIFWKQQLASTKTPAAEEPKPQQLLNLIAAEAEANASGQSGAVLATLPPEFEIDAYLEQNFPGVLILLVPGSEVSWALLVRTGEAPLVVELPQAGASVLREQAVRLRDCLPRPAADLDPWDYAAERAMRHRVWDVLDWLWDSVATPMLAALNTPEGVSPRLWWVPIGDFAFLPLHAAGKHPRTRQQVLSKKTDNLWEASGLGPSTYLPHILRTPLPDRTGQSTEDSLLFISNGVGAQETAQELSELAALRGAQPALSVCELTEQDSSIEAVLRALSSHRYVHLGAHGVLDDADALAAGVQLTDGRLTLEALNELHVPAGELAVLFTCDSGYGHFDTPNEALHVAGAVLNAGFRNVVASTLPLRSSSAVKAVAEFYQELQLPDELPLEHVADAVHHTVQRLRGSEVSGLDPLAWVPYAHFGRSLNSVIANPTE